MAIAWGRIDDAYGPAQAVPGLIARLGGGADDATLALRELGHRLVHQGSVFPATAAAVPLLVALVDDPQCQIRAEILELLGSMLEHREPGPPRAVGRGSARLPAPDDFGAVLEAVHDAVGAGLGVYEAASQCGAASIERAAEPLVRHFHATPAPSPRSATPPPRSPAPPAEQAPLGPLDRDVDGTPLWRALEQLARGERASVDVTLGALELWDVALDLASRRRDLRHAHAERGDEVLPYAGFWTITEWLVSRLSEHELDDVLVTALAHCPPASTLELIAGATLARRGRWGLVPEGAAAALLAAALGGEHAGLGRIILQALPLEAREAHLLASSWVENGHVVVDPSSGRERTVTVPLWAWLAVDLAPTERVMAKIVDVVLGWKRERAYPRPERRAARALSRPCARAAVEAGLARAPRAPYRAVLNEALQALQAQQAPSPAEPAAPPAAPPARARPAARRGARR